MVGISDHESLSSHIRVNKYAQKIKEKHPDFKIALGNEIYLTKDRARGQKYYHFLLCAKDAQGHRILRELSSNAWMRGYYDRGVQRVPTLYEELEEIVNRLGHGHLIASSACIGSMVGQQLLAMRECEENGNAQGRKNAHNEIVQHMMFCKRVFGDDFYLELAPALYPDQVYVNKRTLNICKAFDVKATVQDDTHRLTNDDFVAHAAFLNSKQGEREDIASFYQYTYLQSYDEIRKHMEPVGCDVDQLFANSMEMYDKVEEYSLLHPQQVTQVPVPDFPKKEGNTGYKYLDQLYQSDNPQERYWVNYCVDELKKKGLDNEQYMSELDNEADVQLAIGNNLGTCIFSYPIFLQHYFDLIWECGGVIGTGRGSSSAGLDNYLMNLTQYDPIKAGVNNYFRYLNKSRYELPDLDFDLPPTVRPKWFEKIREERGELGLVQVCTFSTMSSKASVLAACRGYRTKDYPKGIDNDVAQYLTSLIGSERGFTYTISDMINGNKEKGLRPNATFINAVNEYPGLLDIIKKIEGVISARSIHASGVVFNDKGHEYDNGCMMTAPDGTLITQWSLHDAEAAGKVKIDALVTDVCEKLTQSIFILQEHGVIELELSLKEAYDKYLHPDILPLESEDIWDAIDAGTVYSVFQFDTAVGGQAVKKLKPRSIQELSAINALIRLMAQEKGAETPVDRYYRIQQHPEQWDEEMDGYGLTEAEKDVIKEYCAGTYGTLPLQDDLMLMMMDERLFGFDLETTNSARKIIGKKLMDKIPELHKKIVAKAKSPALGKYIWEVLFSQELGYAFNKEHTYSYSLIGFQCAYLATRFPEIYWNTACLRVEAGLEDTATTNYKKIAKAIGSMTSAGIAVGTVDINKSQYLFNPDPDTGSILYGMKGLNGVGSSDIAQIIENRPFTSFNDFKSRTNIDKTATVALIKAGAFDEFDTRENAMREFLMTTCNAKKKVTLQNFNALIEEGLVPPELDFQRRLFNFNKALKANCAQGDCFAMSGQAYYDFIVKFFGEDCLVVKDNALVLPQNTWKKLYNKGMEPAKAYLKEHQEEVLQQLNDALLSEEWNKYAEGNLSHWEMASMGFYHGEHELSCVNPRYYQIEEFADLPAEPVSESEFKGVPIRRLTRIMGCVISKDDVKSSVTLVTVGSGIVNVKMSREEYARINKRLSTVNPDGTKSVLEAGWTQRGNLLVFSGYRRGDVFFAKKYRNTKWPLVAKIVNTNPNGTVLTTDKRANEDEG